MIASYGSVRLPQISTKSGRKYLESILWINVTGEILWACLILVASPFKVGRAPGMLGHGSQGVRIRLQSTFRTDWSKDSKSFHRFSHIYYCGWNSAYFLKLTNASSWNALFFLGQDLNRKFCITSTLQSGVAKCPTTSLSQPHAANGAPSASTEFHSPWSTSSIMPILSGDSPRVSLTGDADIRGGSRW